MVETPERQDSTVVMTAAGELATSLLDWVRESLDAGLEIASRSLELLDSSQGVNRVIAPPETQLAGRKPRESIGLGQASADAALLPFVQALPDARTVLVEDELALRGDLALHRELDDESRWAKMSSSASTWSGGSRVEASEETVLRVRRGQVQASTMSAHPRR
jgi:hypothetical protein